MKLIVKKSHLKITGIIIFVIICIVGWISVYNQRKVEADKKEDHSAFSYPIRFNPTEDPTVVAEDDEMIRKGIEESEQQWQSKHTGGKDWYPELVKARQRTRDIYDAQAKVNITYKPIDDIKALRKRILYEWDLWHVFHSDMSDEQIQANEKIFTDYTDNITCTATRQRLLEQLVGLDWDIDKKEYKEETNGE
jgi:hypothetical protein